MYVSYDKHTSDCGEMQQLRNQNRGLRRIIALQEDTKNKKD